MIITTVIERDIGFPGPGLGVEKSKLSLIGKDVMQAYIFHANSERRI